MTPDLPADKRPYHGFLAEYLGRRILKAITQKLGGSETLERKLHQIATGIHVQDSNVPYDQLEGWISRDIFGNKARLMRDFDSKIERLAAQTSRRSRAPHGSRATVFPSHVPRDGGNSLALLPGKTLYWPII